jgi:hypothetical protein
MAVADLLTGRVQAYYAPYGEALPSENSVAYGVAWGGNWVALGYTDTPLAVGYTSEEFEIEIQEALGVVERIKTKEAMTLEVTLSELTATNISLATEGVVTPTAAGGAQVGKEELDHGGVGTLTKRAWGFEGLYTTSTGAQFPVRLFIYKGTGKLNGALTFGKAEKPGVALQVQALVDLTKTVGSQMFKFQKILADHT